MEENRSELKHVHLKDYEPVGKEVLETLPEGLVVRKKIIPLSMKGGRLVAAVPSSDGAVTPQGLQIIAHCPVDLVIAPLDEIITFIHAHYGSAILPEEPAAARPLAGPLPSDIPPALARLLDNGLINRASEILVEKEGERIRVRQRIRGVLVSDLKTNFSLAEAKGVFDHVHRAGQTHSENGLRWGELQLDFPVRGEHAHAALVVSESTPFSLLTIRLNRGEEPSFKPESWGMGPNQAKVVEAILRKKQGVLLFCGTDSDEISRSLLACAKEVATSERSLILVESVLQHWLPGAEHLVSNNDPDQFLKLLKVAFRHTPDVLLVDPLETREQIELCLSESLKGRLVLCRSFAKDTADALVQMMGMNLEPYLVGSALLGLVAQKQIRLTCPLCQEKDVVSHDRQKEMGIPFAMQPPAFFHGRGCDSCFKTGFDRETNIFEVLELSEEIRNKLHRGIHPEDVRNLIKANGMMTLRQVAIHKALNGQTSLAEVLRVTP